MRKSTRILLTGGGSGGHIIPNLAVASAIKNKQPAAQLLYLASRGRLDANLLGPTGIPFRQIFSGKFRRYFSGWNFIDPFFFLIGFFQSLFILLRFRPHVVFSKGGFVSLPVVMAAFALNCPIILHESDSRMGLANRITSRLANKICVSFPDLVHKEKTVFTGNPIRPEITQGEAKKGYELTHFTPDLPVLLVWGGSQGSMEINQLLADDFDKFVEHFQIVHITGANQIIHKTCPHYVNPEYLDSELKHIYAITDLVIGRAGANSLFEIAAVQKPNIIIPLGNADQLGNAAYFEEKGAGMIYKKTDNLFDLTWQLWQNKSLQASMKKALGEISKKDAAEKIAEMILVS